MRKKCNELDGKTWLQYSISVWDDIKKNADEKRISHPAMFPTQLIDRLLKTFTSKDERVVIDPFMGSGSTIIAAKNLGKKGIGFEISGNFIEIANKRLGQQELPFNEEVEKDCEIHKVDANNLLKYLNPNSVDICITSPPYWDILTQKRTADYKEIRHYGNLENDLGRVSDYNEFLNSLKEVFKKVYQVLKPSKYCIVIVMDLRKKDKFYLYHTDIINLMKDVNFILDDIIIWNRKNEYNNLRPLGYPSVFRINKIHEYILIFKTTKRE